MDVMLAAEMGAALSAALAVDLPYPRHRNRPELLRLRREALGLLGMGGDW
jgi:NitT/TauT family transport system ATP-binding protein